MRTSYSNFPGASQKTKTVQGFEGYQSLPMGIDPTVYAALTGFFQSRGFQEVASESISEVIILQAKQDGYNPMQILDTLKGFTDADISGLVAEILNYNRYKSSSLGIGYVLPINPEILRNIIA